MTNIVAGYLAAVIFVLIENGNCIIPDYIQVCHHDNPDLAGCITNSIEALRPRLEVGISEIGVPPIEPLGLDNISFSSSTEATRIATNITKVQVWGASKFQILKLSHKTTKVGHNFQFEVLIPQVYIKGHYAVNSRVLLLVLKGQGPFKANITDFHFECQAKSHRVEIKGSTFLKFEKLNCNLVVGQTSILLENLFDGNPVISKATNDAINENSDVFFEEIKPSIMNAVVLKFTDIANKLTLNFKYEELFP